MVKGLAHGLARQHRRRRIWLKAKCRVFERQSTLARCGSRAPITSARVSMPSSTVQGGEVVGLVCASVAAAVDFVAMWGRLEQLLGEPRSSTGLSSVALTEAVPILLRGPSSNVCHQVHAAAILSGSASPSFRGRRPDCSSPRFLVHQHVQIQSGQNGRGMFAEVDLPAGTTFLVEKPIVGVLDLETRRTRPWADLPSADTSSLACSMAAELASQQQQVLLPLLAPLHPKEGSALPVLAADDEEDEEEAALAEQMRSDVVSAFSSVPGGRNLMPRMEAIARLNGLGSYTNSEQLCYTEHYKHLTGTVLCILASALNHSCTPNATRFAIGDVLVFRTNTLVAAGQELCISYIESEALSEHRALRQQSLDRDFQCSCSKCSAEDGAEERPGSEEQQYFSMDPELQMELAAMPPHQRVDICTSLLAGRVPAEFGGEEGEDSTANGRVEMLLKDAQEVRAVLGLALTQCGRLEEAWDTWVQAARLLAARCPPFDEALYVYALHAALSAAGVGSPDGDTWAVRHLRAAAILHRAAFGGEVSDEDGGAAFFRCRNARELELAMGDRKSVV